MVILSIWKLSIKSVLVNVVQKKTDVGKAWSDFTGSSTTPPIASNLVAATRGLQHQRWPDIQVNSSLFVS